MDWTHSLANQGPFVLFLALCGWAGYKDYWGFTVSFNKIIIEKDKVIAEKDKVITALTEFNVSRIKEITEGYENRIRQLTESYEARLKDKDEECQRVIDRSAKTESYVDRLIAVGMSATTLATRVTQNAAESAS